MAPFTNVISFMFVLLLELIRVSTRRAHTNAGPGLTRGGATEQGRTTTGCRTFHPLADAIRVVPTQSRYFYRMTYDDSAVPHGSWGEMAGNPSPWREWIQETARPSAGNADSEASSTWNDRWFVAWSRALRLHGPGQVSGPDADELGSTLSWSFKKKMAGHSQGGGE